MERSPLAELSNTRCVMKSDSLDNRLRLSQALNPYKNATAQSEQRTKASAASAQPSTDAVTTEITARPKQAERSSYSGRTFEEVKDLVRSGQYFAKTSASAVAEALKRELLG